MELAWARFHYLLLVKFPHLPKLSQDFSQPSILEEFSAILQLNLASFSRPISGGLVPTVSSPGAQLPLREILGALSISVKS